MRDVWLWVPATVLLLGCQDASAPAAGPVLDRSAGLEDSTSAHALNQRLLTRDASAVRLPRAPTERDGRPWSGRKYIVGFHGAGEDLRGQDQAVLRAAGAVERYYFYGFRATAVYLDSASLRRIRVDPAVAWIDSTDVSLAPLGETTGWSFTRHHFDLAQSADYWGDGDVRVGVIGDGIQCSLPDLSCGTGVNITGDPDVDGGSSHETMIASIIAAAVGNGVGIKGGAPYTSVHSVRAANPWTHELGCSEMAEAIDIAAAPSGLDVDIINLSYGEVGADCGPAGDSAFAYAVWGEGVIVVTGSGNGGIGQVAYPGTDPRTLAVSSMKYSPFKISAGSNYGPEVDIAAGGESVKVLDRTGSVVTITGTSYAAPHVVAALALLYGQKISEYGCKPDRDEAMAALFDNTQDPDLPIIANWYGAGALDVYAALTADWVLYTCPEW